MSLVPSIKKKEFEVRKFLDWDKFENQFYNNLYLDEYKIVVKIPIIKRENRKQDIKIKKFHLEQYTFLVSYD
jgi:hypothetical protein